MAAARRAFDESDWPHRPAAERAKLCERLAAAIHERSDELADLITEESGCTLFLSQVYQWSIVQRRRGADAPRQGAETALTAAPIASPSSAT